MISVSEAADVSHCFQPDLILPVLSPLVVSQRKLEHGQGGLCPVFVSAPRIPLSSGLRAQSTAMAEDNNAHRELSYNSLLWRVALFVLLESVWRQGPPFDDL